MKAWRCSRCWQRLVCLRAARYVGNMTLVVVAEASDGYRAVFSLAELDGDFAGAQVIVADTEDGKPLDTQHGPLRLGCPETNGKGAGCAC
jgi:hypothetical protein